MPGLDYSRAPGPRSPVLKALLWTFVVASGSFVGAWGAAATTHTHTIGFSVGAIVGAAIAFAGCFLWLLIFKRFEPWLDARAAHRVATGWRPRYHHLALSKNTVRLISGSSNTIAGKRRRNGAGDWRRNSHRIHVAAMAIKHRIGNDTTDQKNLQLVGSCCDPGASKTMGDMTAIARAGMRARPHTSVPAICQTGFMRRLTPF
jgi:hypothetical protein